MACGCSDPARQPVTQPMLPPVARAPQAPAQRTVIRPGAPQSDDTLIGGFSRPEEA